MNKRVYISLPITGFQLEERRAYAKKVAENIREKSLDKEKIKTITPFDINEDLSLPYSQLMGKDIAALLECSAILLCKGWEKVKAAGWKRQRRTYMTWRFYLKNKHTRQYDFQKRYSRI